MLRRSQKNLKSQMVNSGEMRASGSNTPTNPGTNDDAEILRQKRKQKQKRFAWLAKFLRSRPSASTLEDKGILQKNLPPLPKNAYFGVPVAQVYAEPSSLIENVPKPLYLSAKALMEWLSIEGLFRVSGIFSEMNRMKEMFETGRVPDFGNVDSRHSIAGLLELWFRELPEPITSHALYDQFMNCVGDNISSEQSILNLQKTIALLPQSNVIVLSFFLRFMNVVSSKEGENKMGAKNLGVVFGSILLGGAVLCFSLGLKTTLQRQNTIVQLMIENVETLFPDYRFEEFFKEYSYNVPYRDEDNQEEDYNN